MTTKEYPELLLCRFTREQRDFIRRQSKKWKMSDAAIVRQAILTAIQIQKHGASFAENIVEPAKITKKYSQRIKV